MEPLGLSGAMRAKWSFKKNIALVRPDGRV